MRDRLWAPVLLVIFAVLFFIPTNLTAQNTQPAQDELRKRAESGDAAAQNELGRAYQYGRGTAKDFGEAVQWYRKSAERGNSVGQLNLGIMYELGFGVPQNNEEAVRWYRKSAEQGNADAEVSLGDMYANGRGVPKDDTEALRWFRKAAEQGDAGGQTMLAWVYESGRFGKQDYAEAARWYRKAAEQGNSTAQSNLGNLYHRGSGVPQDDKESVRWYRKAADQGYGYGLYNLGTAYESGYGVERDTSVAVYFYLKAAEKGIAEAKTSLAKFPDVAPRAPSENSTAAAANNQRSATNVNSAYAAINEPAPPPSPDAAGCGFATAKDGTTSRLCRLGEFAYLEEWAHEYNSVLKGGAKFQRSADGKRTTAVFGAVTVSSELVDTKVSPDKFVTEWLNKLWVVERRIQSLRSDIGLTIQEAFVDGVPATKIHFISAENDSDYLNYVVLIPVKERALIVTAKTPFRFSKKTLNAEYAELHASIDELNRSEAAIDQKAEEWDRDQQYLYRKAMNSAIWGGQRKDYDNAVYKLKEIIKEKQEKARSLKNPLDKSLMDEKQKLEDLEWRGEQDSIDTFSKLFPFELAVRFSPSFRERALKEGSQTLLTTLNNTPKGTFIDPRVQVSYPTPEYDMEVLHRRDEFNGSPTLTFHKRGGWLKIIRTASGQYMNNCMNPTHKICKLENKSEAMFAGEGVTKQTFSTRLSISHFKDYTVLQTHRPSGVNYTIIHYWNSKIKDHWDPASMLDSIMFLDEN